jgi:hypothetical protein
VFAINCVCLQRIKASDSLIACYHILMTSKDSSSTASTVSQVTFQDVFLSETGLFWNLSVALAILCLHERDPVLASFAVVCRHSVKRKNDVMRAMEMAMRSVLHLSNPIILGVANSLTLPDYIHFYRRFHRIYPGGNLGHSIALRDAAAVERFIPLGFNGDYLTLPIGRFDDDDILSFSRTRTLRNMIYHCLHGQGRLNQLIVYGIFATVANRNDAVSFIDFMMRLEMGGSDNIYQTPRCANLKRLLEESYWISDISDIQPTTVGNYPMMDRVQGLQLTYSPHDLARLNVKKDAQLSVTDDVNLW